MKKAILIGGYCATGKSAFSRRLSDFLHIPCFNKDTLKEAAAQAFGKSSKEARRCLSASIFDVMEQIADRLLLADCPCILESNFKPSEIERLQRLFEKHQAGCLTYIFTADADICYSRYIARDSMRHWVHSAADEDSDRFRQEQLPLGTISLGKVVKVDTTDFSQVDFTELCAVADDFVKQ